MAIFVAATGLGCAEGDASGAGPGTGGGAGAGGVGGTANMCVPGEVVECYAGDPATLGIGRCVGGEQTCRNDGSGFGPCAGQITPTEESCATAEDDDCDGETDDGAAGTCVCEPGEPAACYTGPAETMEVGNCASGTAQCLADGTGVTACEGETLPAQEVCETPGDEDCDGIPCSDPEWNLLAGDTSTDEFIDVQVDPTGNIIALGAFAGSIDLGAGVHSANGTAKDILLAKWSPDGSLLFSKSFGGAGAEIPYGLGLDGNGDIFITGTFNQPFAFDTGPTLNPTGPFDGFLVKLSNADGSHIWTQDWGNSGGAYTPSGIAVDASGAATVVGNYVTPPGCLICLFDAFVRRFGPTGVPLFHLESGGLGAQLANAVAVDATGNIWIGGTFSDDLDFGQTVTSTEGRDAFLTKLDALGAHDVTLVFGDSDDDSITDVVLDGTGGPAIAGTFTESINLGGAALTSAGQRDYFVARLNAAGEHVFSNRYGDVSDQTVLKLAVDSNDNVLIAGALRGTATFAGTTLASNGGDDAFIVKISKSGFFEWGKHFGDKDYQAVFAVASGPDDKVYLAGRAEGTIDFGDGQHSASNSRDAFLAAFWP